MYQEYDFVKEINNHINKSIPIDLNDKSKIFKQYLFKLKIFKLDGRVKKSHQMFSENFFIFSKGNKVFIAKRVVGDRFDNVEIIDGIDYIRQLKLTKINRLANIN